MLDKLDPAKERLPSQELTNREYEVLALLAAGYPMKQIVYRLGITHRTVTFHKYKMMQRLGVRTNAGLVHYALCYVPRLRTLSAGDSRV